MRKNKEKEENKIIRAAHRLLYTFNHVFYPPELPQEDDADIKEDLALTEDCRAALESFMAYLPPEDHLKWAACVKMLSRMLQIRDPCGDIMVENVKMNLGEMTSGDILLFHIRGQNAGLIIRAAPEKFVFESFELSPTTAAVMATKGRLRRYFPGPAIALDHKRMAEPSFREALAQLLARLDMDTPIESVPVVSKAGSHTTEIRDTVHPKFVTEMLTGILRGVGQPAHISRIHKRTRDEVLWKDALKPWRRSSLWLLLRVALQTSLAVGQEDHGPYKSFMVYFMARILKRALQAAVPSDTLFVMATKISRRSLKLSMTDEQPWMRYVHEIVAAAQAKITSRWHAIEQKADPLGLQSKWNPSQLSFKRDTGLSLSNLRPYLDGRRKLEDRPLDSGKFQPNCGHRILQLETKLPQFDSKVNDRLSLIDVEIWVQEHLYGWLCTNLTSQDSCTRLAALIQAYTTVARPMYAESAEDTSVMLLTVMDLWVALDKCATHQYPLLGEYDSGFPRSLFDPLLLPKRVQLERLVRVEQHIDWRRSESTRLSALIFRDINKVDSFAVKYFDHSFSHQELRRKIELAAELKRAQKREELTRKREEHSRLVRELESLSHEKETGFDGYREYPIHPSSCYKCQLTRRADGLDIAVHEWPLPQAEIEAKCAVFELDVPVAISKWRDTTHTLLVDIFSPRAISKREDRVYSLVNFDGLKDYVQGPMGRLQLASNTKPFCVAHYHTKKIPQATDENICVNNGLRYSMYDSESRRWTTEAKCDIWRICTLQLPTGSYDKLQYAVDKTTHTSNEVIAWQSECPTVLNLHEYYQFATLRSGHRLQWRNVARELTACILNFSREETHILIAQAAWQAQCQHGARVCREAHVDLEEEEFGRTLLSVLHQALDTVEGNWQGATAVRTFVILATRLLSLSSHRTIHDGCYLFLRRARDVALCWVRDVGRLLHEEQNPEELQAMNLRALEMALLCHSTFDVDQMHVSALLRTDEDVAVIIECSIITHDRCPAMIWDLPTPLRMLFWRFERLSHFLEGYLRQQVLRTRAGIDKAIQRVWAGYLPGSPWAAVQSPNQRWLMTETSPEGGLLMIVHYNSLDGSLLINGSPLTRLPRPYELHDTYRRLFNEKVLDVVPSKMAGMVFATRNNVCGQQFHFRMHGAELIIRAENPQQTCEVVPLHALDGDFPNAFVQNYVHWLDLRTKTIEWRPLGNALAFSRDNWRMHAEGEELVLSHGEKRLLDIRSPTAKMISDILSPLECATHIHLVLDGPTRTLEIHLPRMKLDFFLRKPWELLESKQFRGMVVDDCQSFGALTGLVNKLVLREARDLSRCVIVPYGSVAYSPDGHHVRVTIDTASATQVKYHAYNIDCQLGRLMDNGRLQSRLFRLYLHAITSNCQVDKLTGRTGTEEALYGLSSAATRSFIELEPTDIELLDKLARLTPRRSFYPEHLQVMQQVDWSLLSPLSQHDAFYEQVASIMGWARSLQIFQEHPTQLPSINTHGVPFLQERAAIRGSSLRVDGFGAEDFTPDHDMVYTARDSVSDSSRELRTCSTAKLVDEWSTDLTACPHLLGQIESWAKPIDGIEQDASLGFDVRYLDAPSTFLPSYWCTLHRLLSRTAPEADRYKVMILMSTLSYSTHANQKLVHSLLALATVPGLRALQPPRHPIFRLQDGYMPLQKQLVGVIKEHALSLYECPEYGLPKLPGENENRANARRSQRHGTAKTKCIERFTKDLIAQWPTANIATPTNPEYNTYIKTEQATKATRASFQSWHRNYQFQGYIKQAQIMLDGMSREQPHLEKYTFDVPPDPYTPKRTHVTFADFMRNPAPHHPITDQTSFNSWVVRCSGESPDHSKLKYLLDEISSRCSTAHERRYAEDLLGSFAALQRDTFVRLERPPEMASLLEAHLAGSEHEAADSYQRISRHLQSGSHSLARTTRMLPRVSPTSILSHLASARAAALPPDWKRSFVCYGLSVAALQRAGRLLAASTNEAELLSELVNAGHQDWDVMRYPEWLLLEIENNILIRQEQALISQEMMSPSSGSNSVMQLNMGLGKSSVIVPIVAAALADTTQLVRVIVLKPLAMQMFQLLVRKLGGMLNRRVLYLPISRSLDINVNQARQIREMYEECMETGSILLLQPEHILSFTLMGLDRLYSGDPEAGGVMVETQDWLYAKSRDILDESDEILSVRFELIYTMGMQRAIEFSPERWAIIEHVLECLSRVVHHVLESYPHGLEVISAPPGGFPRIRILHPLAGDELLRRVAEKLCADGVPQLPLWRLPRTAVLEFLRDSTLSTTAMHALLGSPLVSDSMRSGLLLLRGLFACGVLRFAFEQKRWRVNYGLDLTRTMLSVPYRAKDCPAARAEFSHPDATMVLTCLSYYYGGLSEQQIYASFEALLQSDHAQEEYESWVRDAPGLPAPFRYISGINLSNKVQCAKEVFPPLRLARGLINFYMSSVVFPAEMKEFPHKISSSGWDIAREKAHPTTGFSGTNDSRYVLPLSISQCDLPAQLSTNAKVLDCLLRPENSFEDIGQYSTAGTLDAGVLMDMALKLKVRVILDVGAQVLELQNEEVAHEWLSRIPESTAQAAIFFDAGNELCVLDREGAKEPLDASPFAKQMDQCLVYLDESHTRGTDLKLPADYRAIVTLGPGLTKDPLVQACMRMRKLGKGQSVVFCSSMEIQRKILACSDKPTGSIEVTDVLKWSVSGTCAHTRRSIPLWATQGARHQHHRSAFSESRVGAGLVESLLEPEALSLEQRYGQAGAHIADQLLEAADPSRAIQLRAIREKCREFDVSSFGSALLHEEQERELAPENEREQQVERPPPSSPAAHNLAEDVRYLVTHGILLKPSEDFRPAFETLRGTTAAGKYDEAAWPSDLLVTTDFARTVRGARGEPLDSFLRPVHWIVSCKAKDAVVFAILSPYEVQELLPIIRENKKVTLHVYSPHLIASARPLGDLSFCSLPVAEPWARPDLSQQLGLFAGQLYFPVYEEYVSLCNFLGLCSQRPDEGDGREVACDGFSPGTSRFVTSQVPFIRMILAFRRKGQSFAVSHMGSVLNGELVTRERFS